MKNIFVRNLDPAVTENELRELFEAYGAVETVTVVKDQDTGNSRGFAFVEMSNDNEAEAAIKALNGTRVARRLIRINEARSKHENLEGQIPAERRTRSREALHTRSHRRHLY